MNETTQDIVIKSVKVISKDNHLEVIRKFDLEGLKGSERINTFRSSHQNSEELQSVNFYDIEASHVFDTVQPIVSVILKDGSAFGGTWDASVKKGYAFKSEFVTSRTKTRLTLTLKDEDSVKAYLKAHPNVTRDGLTVTKGLDVRVDVSEVISHVLSAARGEVVKDDTSGKPSFVKFAVNCKVYAALLRAKVKGYDASTLAKFSAVTKESLTREIYDELKGLTE